MSYMKKVQTVKTNEKDSKGCPIYDTTYEMNQSVSHDSVGLYVIFEALCNLRFIQKLVTNFTLTRGSLE